jgi:hypothetical protein
MPGRNKYLLSEKSNSNMIKKSFSFSLVFDKYMTISGFQIEETIDRETSGNLEQLLLAVGR